MRIAEYKVKDNCINLFKLISAMQVMYGHTIYHLKISGDRWFSATINLFQGVPIFFMLSGFLIWFSIERSNEKGGFSKYIGNRFWRIYPEMWLAIAVEIILMCILYSGWNVKDVFLFMFTQSTIFQFFTPDSLRGYGCGTPNGSLWTICVIVQFYIIAWFMYKKLKTKKWYVWVMTIVASIIVSQAVNIVLSALQKELILKLYHQTVIRYLWLFLLGMGIARFFKTIVPICTKWWPLFFGARLIISFTNLDYSVGYNIFSALFIILTIIGFSYKYPNLKLKKDISFGIYLYHMTVVNVMITFGMMERKYYTLVVMAISCIIAYISTILIGKIIEKKAIIHENKQRE